MATWVAYKEIKQRVKIDQVLERYELLSTMKDKGDYLVGCCPIHKGSNPTQFNVSRAKNNFNCFGDCGGGGNVIDLVQKLEGIDFRAAALKLQEWFGLQFERPKGGRLKSAPAAEAARAGQAVGEPPPPAAIPEPPKDEAKKTAEEVKTNLPLKFVLKSLNPAHPYLKDRGLTEATIAAFGVGYFTGKGMMAGRIAIPLHNEHGELVAYVGRWPGDEGWPEGDGKYKLPNGFHKSLVVFNLHRAKETARDRGLIIVEGLFDCMNVHQAGYPNVVSLLGSSLSEVQEQLLLDAVGPGGKVTLLLDGDEAGRKCADGRVKDGAWEPGALRRLASRVYVRVIDLGDGVQPDRLSDEELRSLLG